MLKPQKHRKAKTCHNQTLNGRNQKIELGFPLHAPCAHTHHHTPIIAIRSHGWIDKSLVFLGYGPSPLPSFVNPTPMDPSAFGYAFCLRPAISVVWNIKLLLGIFFGKNVLWAQCLIIEPLIAVVGRYLVI